jgi:dipeptidyl aminopeptidase/acylaminoacyl peptidase
MGGGISIRVLAVSPDVRAAVLYGSMSADDQKNAERIYQVFSNRTQGGEELDTPAEAFERISPVNFLEGVQAAVSIHHGEADTQVPPEWSQDLCGRLEALGKTVECTFYPGQPHTFAGSADVTFRQNVRDFFDRYLK